jgi:Na+/H+ antiporter NhaC
VERPWLRASYILVAGPLCVLGVGLLTGQRWVTGAWRLPAGRLSYVFLASVLAAVAAPMVWVALAEEWGAAEGLACETISRCPALSLEVE